MPSFTGTALSLPFVRQLASEPDLGTKPVFLQRDGRSIVTYRSTRLRFWRDAIEKLGENGIIFIRIMPSGLTPFSVAITRVEFEREFPRVLQSYSWKSEGVYHFPTFPRRANAYIVDSHTIAPRRNSSRQRRKIRSSLIQVMQNRVAELAIGPSTLRNQGRPGMVERARRHLKAVKLSRFAVRSRKAFTRQLEAETERLRRALPGGARNWGAARKALNVFLRDVLYHRFLSEAYGLARLEGWLEVPLDTQVAEAIRRELPQVGLPKWPGMKHVSSEQSLAYQTAAAWIAEKERIARIHLDQRWWRAEAKS